MNSPLAATVNNALQPAGPQAARIAHLGHIFFTVCAVVFLLVVGFMLLSTFLRARRAPAGYQPSLDPDPARERRMTIGVSTAVVISTVALFFLLVSDFSTGRAIHKFAETSDFVSIRLVGHQWWWEATYLDETLPSNTFTTANELHIPVGKPVKIELSSADVIHSFWVPNLHGKKDMVPGHPTAIYLQADRAGDYEGQCAEFCGHEHAKMRLLIVAEPEDKFNAWLGASRAPGHVPLTDSEKRGQQIFLTSTCNMCHAISGTPAGGRLGPNLTHFASRRNLAANSYPNTKGHLGGWILDPQSLKPGVLMPQHSFTGQDLQAILDYVESLR